MDCTVAQANYVNANNLRDATALAVVNAQAAVAAANNNLTMANNNLAVAIANDTSASNNVKMATIAYISCLGG